jgi:hypothetical protein
MTKVLTQVSERQVNGNNLSVKEAKRLVLAALRYCCGELAPDQFLDTYAQTVDHQAEHETPTTVVNHLELA